MKNYLLAGILLAATPSFAAASPLFDARIEAKLTGDWIEVTAVIANHSHHNACFVTHSWFSSHYILQLKNGETIVGAASTVTFSDNRVPPPLIQLVPADDQSNSYFWQRIPKSSLSPADHLASVTLDVALTDCANLVSDIDPNKPDVFTATLTAPIEP